MESPCSRPWPRPYAPALLLCFGQCTCQTSPGFSWPVPSTQGPNPAITRAQQSREQPQCQLVNRRPHSAPPSWETMAKLYNRSGCQLPYLEDGDDSDSGGNTPYFPSACVASSCSTQRHSLSSCWTNSHHMTAMQFHTRFCYTIRAESGSSA